MLEIVKARKKPVEIEAYQYTMQHFEHKIQTPGIMYTPFGYPYIQTLEGNMNFKVGDWIIKGVKGEYYACREDIFNETYEIL